jgi:ABC-2 type transport system ATP-binding protein
MGEPQLILMDEPTTGLDPVSQLVVLDLIREAQARGAAILVSSHQLHDIEKVCDRICLIDRGRVRETVTIQEIRRRSLSRIVVSLALGLPEAVRGLPGVGVQPHGPGEWEITTADVPSLLGLLMPCGIIDIEVRKASLEQYFRIRVGHNERRGDGGEKATKGEG